MLRKKEGLFQSSDFTMPEIKWLLLITYNFKLKDSKQNQTQYPMYIPQPTAIVTQAPEPTQTPIPYEVTIVNEYDNEENLKESINRLINVDFPVRTGPTTPRYMAPPVRASISLYTSNTSIQIPPFSCTIYDVKISNITTF